MSKDLLKAVTIALASYFLFFNRVVIPDQVIYSGKDAQDFHYQTREYLYKSLKSGVIPFWTEKIHGGYPIYADLQRGMLNIPNMLLLGFFGPFTSYKVLHFITYLIGSTSLYFLLKRFGVNLLGYASANLVYFFNFFNLYHQQHFNIILCYYLLPAILVFTHRYIESKKISNLFYKSLIIYFIFTLGHFQLLTVYFLVDLIYFIVFSKTNIFSKHNIIGMLFYLLVTLTLIIPAFIPQAMLFIKSSRTSEEIFTQGSLYPIESLTLTNPFIFGKGDSYFGINLNREYFIHEVYSYMGVSVVLVSLISFLTLKDRKLFVFTFSLLGIFVLLAFVKSIPISQTVIFKFLYFPFSLFRYWYRISSILGLVAAVLTAKYFSDDVRTYSKFNFKPLVSLTLFVLLMQLFSINTETIDFIKLYVKSIFSLNFENLIWIAIVILTLLLIFCVEKKIIPKTMLIIVLLVDLGVFWSLSETKLFLNKNELVGKSAHYSIPPQSRIIDFSNNINSANYLSQDYSNILGYSVLIPNNVVQNLINAGIASTRNADLFSDTNFYDLEKLKDMGVEYSIKSSGSIEKVGGTIFGPEYLLNYRSDDSFVISPNKDFKNESREIDTKINYFYGWALKSGKKIYLGKQGVDGFTVFKNVSDASSYDVFYLPLPLLYGLIVSAVLVVPTMYLKELYDKNA